MTDKYIKEIAMLQKKEYLTDDLEYYKERILEYKKAMKRIETIALIIAHKHTDFEPVSYKKSIDLANQILKEIKGVL